MRQSIFIPNWLIGSMKWERQTGVVQFSDVLLHAYGSETNLDHAHHGFMCKYINDLVNST